MKINARQLNLYAVTDRSWLKPGETLVSVTEEILKAGVTCVQLREKHMSDEEILKEASLLKDLCDSYQVPLIINDRPDLAKKSGASGVHVGLSDMGIQKARNLLGEDFIIGGSAHNVEEALAAEAAGADYLGCGAIFGSMTKTNVSQLPIETLKAICQAVKIPVVAIGGLSDPAQMEELKNQLSAALAEVKELRKINASLNRQLSEMLEDGQLTL